VTQKKFSRFRPTLEEQLQAAQKWYPSHLDLSGYDLTEIPAAVFELKDLDSIDLSYNRLRAIPQRLGDLPDLRTVALEGNPINSLPALRGLTLDVPTYRRCRKQIHPQNITLVTGSEITYEDAAFLVSGEEFTGAFPSLVIGDRTLNMGSSHPNPSTAVQVILESLRRLKFLHNLTVSGWHLGTVPHEIRHLKQLKSLGLDALGLKTLPDWIGTLDLEHLSAIDNKFSALPDSIRNIRSLKTLDLGWNPFNALPSLIFEIESLTSLDLTHCNIHEISADILRLTNLRYFYWYGNPIISPPEEVTKEGLDAVRSYWRQRADTGVDYLCEAKLIILGEAGAGKTSLAKKIENPNYKLSPVEKSTEGIDVIRYQFPTVIRANDNRDEKTLNRDFQVNIWDFGGQEIYHATHQFFLTKRSVYVLVCDDRKEDTDFSYWLQAVEMLSDASPILIVQNEKQDRKRDINFSSLRAQFANLRGAMSSNLDTNRGLDDVIRAIQKELESLPHVGEGLPATWKRVREALEKDERDYIGLEEYLNICQQHGFTRREDKLQLSGYLHDLGICLHFQDDPLLKNTVVLKPAWGTDAVYRVLDDASVIAARGQFTRDQLKRIWSEGKYEGMQDELLRLMMKFQLCYALDTDRVFIAPQLLSSEQPAYQWPPQRGVVVRYEYAFLPKGVIARFIVAMHRLIADEKLVWKTGVVLERDGTRAEVIEEYAQRRIRVRVHGPDARGLLAIIDDQMERLHASFPRLQYERYLPCPCVECQPKVEPYGFALNKLIKMATKGQGIQCHESGEMVDAAALVRDILPGAIRRDDQVGELSPIEATTKPAAPTPEAFVSYAWTPESSAVVDRLQQSLEQHGVHLRRDHDEVRYKESIRDFMRRIGQGKCVVVVISEKYLKSENCMFEMIEIAKEPGLRERIFPIVLADANIYKATGRVKYVHHWENEIRELDEALKTVRGDNLTKLQEDLNTYSEIRRLFDGIADTLRDMNALTPDQHEGSGFEELIRRIRAQLGV
jgi:GTPase SAR1 family protein